MQVVAPPAVIVLGFWFVFQLLSGVATIAMSSEAMMGGVAWWAHIGGFVAGLILTPSSDSGGAANSAIWARWTRAM